MLLDIYLSNSCITCLITWAWAWAWGSWHYKSKQIRSKQRFSDVDIHWTLTSPTWINRGKKIESWRARELRAGKGLLTIGCAWVKTVTEPLAQTSKQYIQRTNVNSRNNNKEWHINKQTAAAVTRAKTTNNTTLLFTVWNWR